MVPMDNDSFQKKVNSGHQHFESAVKYKSSDITKLVFYEFGAGLDLVVPLSLYSLGVRRQIVTDIRKLAREFLILDAMRRLYIDHRQLSDCGIRYIAPFDARSTGLESYSIDVITSTDVLEHIEPLTLRDILKECFRILRPGGIASFEIDYGDHYSYIDNRISMYNFLRYSDKAWSLFNPSLHYQNRLRHSDYIKLFLAVGFHVIEDHPWIASSADFEYMLRLRIAKRFKAYSNDDLRILGSRVVLLK